jgi:RHS repeat-associated protein
MPRFLLPLLTCFIGVGWTHASLTTNSSAGSGGVERVEVLVRGTLSGAGYKGTDAVADKLVWAVLPAGSESFDYDGAGRLIGDANWTYEWNGLGHLIGMIRKAGTHANPSVTAGTLSFQCDADGRWVRKLHTVSYQNAPTQTTETRTLWDGWMMVMEQKIVNGVEGPKKWFTWGRDVSGSWDGAGGIGGLVAIIEEGGRKLLPVEDGLGNIMAVVDAATGATVTKYDHGPYGEVLGAEGEADACPFRYQSKLYDAETGLHYYGYRYYSPKMGRWLSRDPLGEAGGFNLYAYCLGDPINHDDYLGGEPRIVVAHDEAGQIILSESVRIANGVPQVQYSDWSTWWGPLIGGARNRWWQSPSAEEMSRLFRRDGSGWRVAGSGERHDAYWNQFNQVELPNSMRNAQETMVAFAQINGAAAVIIPTLMVSGPALYTSAQVYTGQGMAWWASGGSATTAMWGTRAALTAGGGVAGVEMLSGVDPAMAMTDGAATVFNVGSMTGFGSSRLSMPSWNSRMAPWNYRLEFAGFSSGGGPTGWKYVGPRIVPRSFAYWEKPPQYYISGGVRRSMAARESGQAMINARLVRPGYPDSLIEVYLDQLHSPKSYIMRDFRFSPILRPEYPRIEIQPLGLPGQIRTVPLLQVGFE